MKYWPDEVEAMKELTCYNGVICVKFLKESCTTDYVLREFEVSKEGEVSIYIYTQCMIHNAPSV